MSITVRRIERHKKAKKIIGNLVDKPEHVLIVHYSCESFYGKKKVGHPALLQSLLDIYKVLKQNVFQFTK
jgi:hypothetical protein